MGLNEFAKQWAPAIFWSFFIFVLSSLPGADFSENTGSDFLIRKSLHFVEYFVLTLALFRGTKSVLWSILLAIVYSIFDEVHQNYVPTRTGKAVDVLVDGVAVSFTGLILWKYLRILPMRLRSWLEE
ncbi:VanZ family protein [candidate division WWE3 bacterium]|nr:VanZ family protein [candidate division WWE3 bacterium]